MSETTRALVYTGPQESELREVTLPPMTGEMVEIRTLYSALSRGTERLVFNGKVPPSEYDRMRAPFQTGTFPFPVAYGYAAVGRVEAGPPDLLGREVFSLSPHQEIARLPASAVVPVPKGVPASRAVLAANMETAINATWDAELQPGARVLIVGAGLLGCLIAALLSVRTDLSVSVLDVLPQRSATLTDFPVRFISTSERSNPVAVAFHTSASSAGLQAALDSLEFEGTVIELSWYGNIPVSVDLGGAFHSRRLTIRSSQVGHVAAPRRASTSYRDRLTQALDRLADPRLDNFVTEELSFDALPANLPRLLGQSAEGIATRIRY
ncbi:zinc-binding alcohol dehydrogenase [Rhodobacteraceae bacterium NNCM2]|nr:zinc-binding alcohol dehydrogenase [Coraliihabitans acroporae]